MVYAPAHKAGVAMRVFQEPSVAQPVGDLGILAKPCLGGMAAKEIASTAGATVDAMKVATVEMARLRRDLARARHELRFSYGPLLSGVPGKRFRDKPLIDPLLVLTLP